ncbi:heat shock protein Hsp90 family, partial [Tribonema minus]
EGTDEESQGKVKIKKIGQVAHGKETLNFNRKNPVWTRNPDEVTQDEYVALYKSLTNDSEEYAAVKDFNAGGRQLKFRSLLFVPTRASVDEGGNKLKGNNFKVYVRETFITDNCEKLTLMPEYLRFVKVSSLSLLVRSCHPPTWGVINMVDLPKNTSRESLLQHQILRVIRKNLVDKSIELFDEISEDADKHKGFYKSFSKNIKLGIQEDSTNRAKLAKLLRFYSTKSGEEMTSLDDYVARMGTSQEGIYYVTGESKEAVETSPSLASFRKEGHEVLFMVDTMDDYVMQQLKEYKGKTFVCVSK